MAALPSARRPVYQGAVKIALSTAALGLALALPMVLPMVLAVPASAQPGDGPPLPRPPALAPLAESPGARDLFAMPRVVAEMAEVQRALAAGAPLDAAARLDRLIARHPTLGALQASRAVLYLIAGDGAAAIR